MKVELYLEHPTGDGLNLKKFTELENRLAALEQIIGLGKNPKVSFLIFHSLRKLKLINFINKYQLFRSLN
jgi:hypothetical protein